jgi:hypothetical protein
MSTVIPERRRYVVLRSTASAGFSRTPTEATPGNGIAAVGSGDSKHLEAPRATGVGPGSASNAQRAAQSPPATLFDPETRASLSRSLDLLEAYVGGLRSSGQDVDGFTAAIADIRAKAAGASGVELFRLADLAYAYLQQEGLASLEPRTVPPARYNRADLWNQIHHDMTWAAYNHASGGGWS